MAEAFLDQICGGEFEAHSAGLEAGTLNSAAVQAMQEFGIDISNQPTKAVFDYIKPGLLFAYVITVCDEVSAARCPVFAGGTQRLHWNFPDPASFAGTLEEKLAKTREVRDLIEAKIGAWCEEVCPATAR